MDWGPLQPHSNGVVTGLVRAYFAHLRLHEGQDLYSLLPEAHLAVHAAAHPQLVNTHQCDLATNDSTKQAPQQLHFLCYHQLGRAPGSILHWVSVTLDQPKLTQ